MKACRTRLRGGRSRQVKEGKRRIGDDKNDLVDAVRAACDALQARPQASRSRQWVGGVSEVSNGGTGGCRKNINLRRKLHLCADDHRSRPNSRAFRWNEDR